MPNRRNRVHMMLSCIILNVYIPAAMAGPEGAQVVNGQVTFQQTGLNTTITASNQAIINYSRFNIAQPEVVQFVQPGSSASVLNRILSANPTHIDGTLSANGNVFFVNPAGVYIGPGATINVNQLVASGLNITNADFIDGRYNFAAGEGVVENRGDIVAKKAYLIGKQVANSGTINCPDGYVVMASGDRVFLGEPGSNLMVETDAPPSSEALDRIEGAAILNEGSVEVGGGEIAFAAAGDVYAQAISNVGTLSASTDSSDAGSVNLKAADGTVVNSGSIRASREIAIEGSTIDNSGLLDVSSRTVRINGGSIRVIGDFIRNRGTIRANAADYSTAGSISVIAQHELTLDQTSRIEARGGQVDSRGGDIYLYSHGNAQAKSGQVIDISGGTISGDGGTGELSAAKHVSIAGSVLGYAQDEYDNGDFVVDPPDVSIGETTFAADTTIWAKDHITIDGAPTIDTSGGDVTLSLLADHKDEVAGNWHGSTGTITRSGDFTIAETGTTPTNTATLVMKAADDGTGGGGVGTAADPILTDVDILDVQIRDGSDGSVYITDTGAGEVVLAGVDASGGGVGITAGSIRITGEVTADAGYDLTANAGNIIFDVGGSITGAAASMLTAAGSIANIGSSEDSTIETTKDGSLSLNAANDAVASTEAMTVSSGDSLTLNAPLKATDAKTTLRAQGDIDINKSITAQGTNADDASVTLDAGETTTLNANIITSGQNITIKGDVSLGDPTTVTLDTTNGGTVVSGANVTITDTVEGVGKSLIVNAGEVTTFGGAVGSGGALASVETDGPGTTEINGGSVSAATQTYNDNVILAEDTTLTGTTVNFAKKVDGAGRSLTVNAAGLTTFGGVVGSGGALGSVETDVPGTTAINGGSVAAGSQVYRDYVTLGSGETVLNGSRIEFMNTLNGPAELKVNTTGDGSTVFGGAVGDVIELLSVETNSDGDTRIDGDMTTIGNQIYRNNVTVADGKTLSSGNDIILADGKTLTGEGELTLEAGDNITLGGDVQAASDMLLKANTDLDGGKVIVADHKELTAGRNLQLGANTTLTGDGDLAIEATEGAITSQTGGSVNIDMLAQNKTLSLTQHGKLSLDSFQVEDTDVGNTHLMVEITGDSVFEYNNAGKWKSVQVKASGNVDLSASSAYPDIVIGTRSWDNSSGDSDPGVYSTNGGVSIISEHGTVRTYDQDTPIAIEGTSNNTQDDTGPRMQIGVELPDNGADRPGYHENVGRAAIVIQSAGDLEIGANTTLTAHGTYDPGETEEGYVDDRDAVGFTKDEDPIDIAIYLTSITGNVTVNSDVVIEPDNGGVATVAIDADDTVKFDFEDGLKNNGNFQSSENFHAATRLEAASRETEDLDDAANRGTLPYADLVRRDLWPDWFNGEKYVLRGKPELEALGVGDPAPLAPPILFEPEDSEEVEPDTIDPSVMDDITLAFGEEFFQLPITGAAPDMVAIDEKITEQPRLRIQNYWCILDPVKTPSSGQVIPFLNRQMETMQEPTRENIARFDRTLRSNPAVGKWLDAYVAFVADSNRIFAHDADKLIGTIQNRFLRRYEATSKVQQYMNRYIRIMNQPRPASSAKKSTVEDAGNVGTI